MRGPFAPESPGVTLSGRFAPYLAVAVAVAFGLVELRSEVDQVAYLNDSSIHQQMARYATHQLGTGHLPLDGWWPYLGLGSPQFLHYQGLGSILTGAIGLLTGPNAAFTWTLYLLLATWPVSIYVAARWFGLPRAAAAAAALVSPLVSSRLGIGYEETTYLWIGYGLTTQLWAMWTLPLAWGATWRAVDSGRHLATAACLTALTVALHFMTGYLALAPIALWPFLARHEIRQRLDRAAVVLTTSFLAAGWVIVPVLAQAKWASVNEFLRGTPIADSYGARRVLSWLADGSLLDWGRLPVLSVLALVGTAACVISWRAEVRARAIPVAGALSLVLFFGRPTLGPLTRLIPGSEDLFLRRFLMGVQLAVVFLAGIGAVAIGRAAAAGLRRAAAGLRARRALAGPRRGPPDRTMLRPRLAAAGGAPLALALLVVALYPAWHAVAASDQINAREIASQRGADAHQGVQLAALVARARTLGPGRFYAGLPTNWGATFTVGAVPVFKYLERLDVDEVGYTLRTASLMTDPEAYFDESNPADFAIFGIRYLVLPPGRTPPLPARLVTTSGPYRLFELPAVSYVQVVDTRGSIRADRADIGRATRSFLESPLAGSGVYPTVAFAGASAPTPTLGRDARPPGSPGTVLSERADLPEGSLVTVVRARRRAVVLLSASYDPGWTATVDGHPAATEMVAPALVGVSVGPGVHRIEFRYAGFGGYPQLFALGAAALAGLALAPFLKRRLHRCARRREA